MKANKKYMTEYNIDIVSSSIVYLDAKYSYGGAMSEKLPESDFTWSDDIKLPKMY